jgi:hypothetical protein
MPKLLDLDSYKKRYCKHVIEEMGVLQTLYDNGKISKLEFRNILGNESDSNSTLIKAINRFNEKLFDEYDIQLKFSRTIERYIVEQGDENISSALNSLQNMAISGYSLEIFKSDKLRTGIIQFDKEDKLVGKKYFKYVLEAILNRKQIQFMYKDFYGEESEINLEPYLLKEYNYRWYIFGVVNKHDVLKKRLYSLERIMSDITLGKKFKVDKSIKLNKVFEDTIGVRLSEGEDDIEKKKIIFEIDNEMSSLAKNLVIHESQEILSENEQSTRFSIYVRDNYELYNAFMQYLPFIQIIEPPDVISRFTQILNKALSKSQNKAHN